MEAILSKTLAKIGQDLQRMERQLRSLEHMRPRQTEEIRCLTALMSKRQQMRSNVELEIRQLGHLRSAAK